MKTHIVVIVTDDELDSEDMYDKLELAVPCGCRWCNRLFRRPCHMEIMSMDTFRHGDDDYVDFEPTVMSMYLPLLEGEDE